MVFDIATGPVASSDEADGVDEVDPKANDDSGDVVGLDESRNVDDKENHLKPDTEDVNDFAAVEEATIKGNTTLPAGDYYISTAANTQRVVDVSAGSLSDGANVQTWLSNTTGAQKWQVSVDEYGWATITNIGSGKVLDAAGANCAAGTNVWQYAANGTDAQKWSIEQQADGTWIIRSALSDDLVLDVAGAVDADGANLQIWTDNGTQAQRFVFTGCDTVVAAGTQTITPGTYGVYFSPDTTRCLDLSGASFAQGANLQIWSVNGTYAQMYQFIWDAQAGAYEIVVLSSGKVLGVSSASPLINGNVAQYSANGSLSQRWRADANGDGTYTFYNMATGRVLDVAGAIDADGTNVGTYISNGTGAQRFVLESVETLVEDGTYTLYSNLAGDRVVDVPAASTGVGVQLQIYSSNGTLAQRLSFTAQQDGSYHIRALNSGLLLADSGGGVVQTNVDDSSACWNISMAEGGMVLTNVSTGKVMDVAGASTALGTSLQTYESNGTLAQRFRLVEVDPLQSGAAYELAPASSSSLRADVAGGSRADGANLQVYTANDTNAQKFVFTKVGTHWRITGAKTGKAIDVLNADGSSGANVQMWYTNGSDAQLWDVVVDEAGDYVISSVISGTCLTVADPGNADSCNIAACTLASPPLATQSWRLVPTSVKEEDSVLLKAADIANLACSDTGYLILVDLTSNRTMVYQGASGNWELIENMICSTGAPSTPTVLGEYTIGIRGYSFGSGYTCYYYTQFYGDYLFHSVLYWQGTRDILDGTLGESVSHGCVRLEIGNAEWIYDNIPSGTKVITYY